MKEKRTAGMARTHVLQAAQALVLAGGSSALTLDAVARQAGVSKGGLLYHFPSKEALISGMIAQLCEEFDAALEHWLAADAEDSGAGRWLRAYVRVCFESEPLTIELSAVLLAAMASNPVLLDPLRERFDRWQASAEADGLDPALATAVRLAADGLWVADMGGFAPPSGQRRAAVLAYLLQLAR